MTQLEIPFPELLTPATLADAFDYFHDANSDHPRKSAIRSSIKAMGKGIGLPLDQIPADAVRLRPMLAKASAARAGLKPSSWKSMKSLALRSLQDAGVDLAPGRDTSPISAACSKETDSGILTTAPSGMVESWEKVDTPA